MFIKSVIQIIRREQRRFFARRSQYFLALILPIALFLILASIYKNGVVLDIPVAICDQDHSELSRLLTRSFESTRALKIVAHVQSVAEIQQGFQKGKWQAAIVLPADLEGSIKRGRTGTLVVYRNDANLIIGNSVLKDALTISRTVSAGILIKQLRSRGITEDRAMNIAVPIQLDTRSLYNPSYNYTLYLLPGLLTAMLQMVVMLSSVLLFSTEFREKTISALYELAGRSSCAMFLGKLLPYVSLYSIIALAILKVLLPALHADGPVHLWPTLLFTVLFVAAAASMGLLASIWVHDQMMATEIAVFINTPAFMFSGYTFPLWGMPALHVAFAQMMPFTHFISGFMKLYFMNAGLQSIFKEAVVLLGFLMVSGVASVIILQRQMRVYDEAI